MEKEIEELVLKILDQVSRQEQQRNKVLLYKKNRVLKALAYLKATIDNKKLGA